MLRISPLLHNFAKRTKTLFVLFSFGNIQIFKVCWNDHLDNYFSLIRVCRITTNLLLLTFSHAKFYKSVRSKILIIAVISNETNKWIKHICKIISKRHNILPTRDGLFISGAGKIGSVWEFIMKSFMQLIHWG